jgi:ribonucleoside-diphosphate reductase alpha chain
MGCKGVTYFRDGSRDVSVLESIDKKGKTKSEAAAEAPTPAATVEQAASTAPAASGIASPAPRKRPEAIPGMTYKVKTGYGTMFVTINHDQNGQPFEVFATVGKAGGVFAAKSEAICRLISLSLRSGIAAETVIDQLRGIRGPMPIWGKNGQVLSIPDAIAQVMTEHMQSNQAKLNLQFSQPVPEPLQNAQELLHQTKMEEVVATVKPDGETIVTTKTKTDTSIANLGIAPECPECGNMLAMSEGCMMCHGCGYSKCA